MSKENLTIGQKDIEVELRDINQAELKFYTENPRVYSVLNAVKAEPSQEEIEQLMCDLDHVKQLKVSIESNGGLIDPLIVRDGDLTVLEGNSRLAAYRLLCRIDPIKWGKVPCKVLPSDISEDTIFALLGQYHIIGRKDWEPFEQAHYLYRRKNQTKLPVEYMAKELGLTKQKAQSMINVIEFMMEKNDLQKRNWSYYEEYLKNDAIKKYRDKTNNKNKDGKPKIDDTFTEAVKNHRIAQASDVRKLGAIAKVGDKQAKKLMEDFTSGQKELNEIYEELEDSGKLDDEIKKLQRFRKEINKDSFENQIVSSDDQTSRLAVFELKKIMKRLDHIMKKLDQNITKSGENNKDP